MDSSLYNILFTGPLEWTSSSFGFFNSHLYMVCAPGTISQIVSSLHSPLDRENPGKAVTMLPMMSFMKKVSGSGKSILLGATKQKGYLHRGTVQMQ